VNREAVIAIGEILGALAVVNPEFRHDMAGLSRDIGDA
jgi:hypothetical protein